MSWPSAAMRPPDTICFELKVLVYTSEERDRLTDFLTRINRRGRGLLRVNLRGGRTGRPELMVYDVWAKTEDDFMELRGGVMRLAEVRG